MTDPLRPSPGSVLSLLAPLSGVIVPLESVPDEAFAQRLAGDGASIDPLGSRVVAPCDATVLQVHRAHHALTLSAGGLEIMIHVGLDTVGLRGAGFTPHVRAGDEVRAGDPLLSFDPDAVARDARSLLTQVLVTNVDAISAIEPNVGTVVAGRDVLMRVTLAGSANGDGAPLDAAAAQAAQAALGPAVVSDPIVVTVESGLHARPAGVLAAAARRFTADVRVRKGAQEANARSVVSIMALEVAEGDTVTLVARGGDARDAITAIAATLTGSSRGTHAPAAGRPTPTTPMPAIATATDDGTLRGVAASPGVGVGQVYHLRHDDTVAEERAKDPTRERRALDDAIGAAHAELEVLQARLAADADEEQAAIFAAHRELLADPELLDRAIADIRGGKSAAWAWKGAYTSQADRLVSLKSTLLAGRATDLRDVGRRVLRQLTGDGGVVGQVPNDAIVVAEDLTPSDAAGLDRSRVRGFCTTMGSASSHVAILARGLGIPAVAGIDARVLALPDGTRAILDGDRGLLRPGPSPAEEAEVVRRRAVDDARRQVELAAAMQPATTRDGHRVEVVANIGALEEARSVPAAGGEGVGLLRSEFLFMERRTAPTEDEQTASYEAIAKALGPDRILVIRTLDVGGDKPLPYLEMAAEANPFLGERGIRLTLARPELMRAQVRAILRASRSGKVAIMFPMIATQAEWQAGRAMVEEERVSLGVEKIQVGLMIETAAAALTAERFARDADFFSIGTNDLTQYTLAMDRTNPRLAPQVDALHPSVLRLIERTVAGAKAHGRWVGVCGGLASDLAAVPVLLGLGVDELSADVPLVPAVKARVRALSMEECRLTAQQALDAADGAEVRAIVAQRHG